MKSTYEDLYAVWKKSVSSEATPETLTAVLQQHSWDIIDFYSEVLAREDELIPKRKRKQNSSRTS